MDISDQATMREEQERDQVLQVRRTAGPQSTGRCHFCDEIVDDHARWCDSDCRDGWEKEQKRGAR